MHCIFTYISHCQYAVMAQIHSQRLDAKSLTLFLWATHTHDKDTETKLLSVLKSNF